VSGIFSSLATPEERKAMAEAIAHNCDCYLDNGQTVRCASHSMALAQTPADALTLQRLLYVRRVLLPRLAAQEFGI
jgi:hypothetical protein